MSWVVGGAWLAILPAGIALAQNAVCASITCTIGPGGFSSSSDGSYTNYGVVTNLTVTLSNSGAFSVVTPGRPTQVASELWIPLIGT